MMPSSAEVKRKQSLYFPEDMLNEIAAEATRQDRSMSWIVQQTWRLASARMKAFATGDVPPRSPKEDPDARR